MGKKDERTVGVQTFSAVVVPVRKGKGITTVRFEELKEAVGLAKTHKAKIVFDVPGESDPVDLNLTVVPDEPVQKPLPLGNGAEIPKKHKAKPLDGEGELDGDGTTNPE